MNNMCAVVMGKLDKTPAPYQCTREEKQVGKTMVTDFTNEISLAIRATALFHIQQQDIMEIIREYTADNFHNIRMAIGSETSLEIYWLRGCP
jgi:hypothetical protein